MVYIQPLVSSQRKNSSHCSRVEHFCQMRETLRVSLLVCLMYLFTEKEQWETAHENVFSAFLMLLETFL